jgi:hypothetical protein
MSQDKFAFTFGISASALRNWQNSTTTERRPAPMVKQSNTVRSLTQQNETILARIYVDQPF